MIKSIKRIKIRGFKKFKKIDVEFNDKTNIIVGDNESGKKYFIRGNRCRFTTKI